MGIQQEDFTKALLIALSNEQVSGVLGNIFAKKLKTELSSLRAEIQEKDKAIKQLEKKVTDLQNETDRLEQYSRRNSIRITNVPEDDDEDTSEKVFTLVNEKMRLEPPLDISEIDRLHRVGRKENTPRAIIVKFATYRSRKRVYEKRSSLKDLHTTLTNAIFINEDLTSARSKLFSDARKMYKDGKINGTWTRDGTVLVKNKNNQIVPIRNSADLIPLM